MTGRDWAELMVMLATVAMAVIALRQAEIAKAQAEETKRVAQANNFIAVSEMMKGTFAVRHKLLSKGFEFLDTSKDAGDHALLHDVRPTLAVLNTVAFMVEKDMVDPEWVTEMWGATMAKIWQACEGHVAQLRADENSPSLFDWLEAFASDA